ncbi:MAG: hypothetical protein KDA75_00710 [Planctomycetaceae bacterium]|nr:hypothetical protein [Planctomycetaceae bacterium]
MIWKRVLLTIVVAAAAALAWRVAVRGEQLERRLLRAGGGLVQAAAQRPRRTLTAFAVVLGGVWLGVAGTSWAQGRRRTPEAATSSDENSNTGEGGHDD